VTIDTTFYNQATLKGLPPPFSSMLLSDERTTELKDDPSPIQTHSLPDWGMLGIPTAPFCMGDTARLSATANRNGTFHWQGPLGLDESTSSLDISSIDLHHQGRYHLEFKDARTCQIDTFFNLELHPFPELGLGNDTSLCLIDPYVLRPNNFLRYEWQDGSEEIYYIVESYGQFVLSVLDEHFCYHQDTIELLPSCPAELYLPNAFSPNGDGVNDRFYAYGNDVRLFQFQIFNRWGAVVFESDNMLLGWDGDFESQAMPIGIYTYWIKATFANGEEGFFSGDVLLIR